MIKDIVRDPVFLTGKSEDATVMDLKAATDLRDTFNAKKDICAGMAANMIGVRKNIIIVDPGIVMINPVIVSAEGKYTAEEGCLSLPGTRKTERYKSVTVNYYDESFHRKTGKFNGWTAEIIQHEIDHCHGILI